MRISDFSIKHPAIITILLIAVLIFSLFSLSGMRQELLAKVELPQIMLITVYPGAGPKNVEEEITNPLEDILAGIDGITSLQSYSYQSLSTITIKFDFGTDISIKKNDIRDKINNGLHLLPDEIEGPPEILEIRSNMAPIYTLLVESEYDNLRLSHVLKEQVKPRLSNLSGVSLVDLYGIDEEIIEIKLIPEKMENLFVSALEIFQLLKQNNTSLPGGDVHFRNSLLSLRTEGRFQNIDDIRNMVVGFKDGSYIRLKELARVQKVLKKKDFTASSASKSAITINIYKKQNSDSRKIIESAQSLFREIEQDSQGMLRFKPIVDTKEDIHLGLSSVILSAQLGAFLAILILLVFLHNFRAVLIIVISIPFSLFLSIITMQLMNLSINIMTLAGLTVSIGMIVDASIVILENTHKHLNKGLPSPKAASTGAREVGSAVLASATTSISVFLPIIFIPGYAGVLLSEVAWVIIFALAASTLTALVTVPFLSSRILKKNQGFHKIKNLRRIRFFFHAFDRKFHHFSMLYGKALQWALRNRKFMLIGSSILLIISLMMVPLLGFEFFSAPDMNEFEISVLTPPGFSLEQTEKKMKQINAIVDELVPEVKADIYYTGKEAGFSSQNKSNSGAVRIRLKRKAFRDRSVFEIINLLQREIPQKVTDVDIRVDNGGLARLMNFVTGGEGFKIRVSGNNWEEVVMSARKIHEIINEDPEVRKSELNINFDQQELVNILDHDDMGTLGVNPYHAALSGRILFYGMKAGRFQENDRSYDIFLNSSLTDIKINKDVLNKINLKSAQGKLVYFSSFAKLDIQPRVDKIPHEDRMKSIIVTALLKGKDLSAIQGRVFPKIKELNLPSGIKYSIQGSADVMISTFKDMLMAMAISIFLVYMVMVIQFERFIQPLIIMGAVPFTLIGAVISLIIGNSTLSIISVFGIIALAGMVVNNAIVLVDYTNLLRKEQKMPLSEALLKSCKTRLKPILMTTLTTVLGIIPLALGMGEGSEIYTPLGQVISGGLLTSTFITLFLIPILYYIIESRGLKEK